MSARPQPPNETDLLAYADGRLDPAARAGIEAWLVQNPERAAEVAHWQRQNEALAALFPPAGDAVPERLDPHRIAVRGQRRWPELAAAAVLLVALGVGAGWLTRSAIAPGSADLLIDHALFAHALYVKERRHPVEVVAADRDHLVSWLSNRIERQIDSPDLAAEGFALVGGRLLPPDRAVPTGPAAQLMFENAAGERLTVYVTGPLPDRRHVYDLVERDGLAAYYWADETITCTVVAALPEAELRTVGRRIFQQLSLRPET